MGGVEVVWGWGWLGGVWWHRDGRHWAALSADQVLGPAMIGDRPLASCWVMSLNPAPVA
jgi:hypothetical protein